jgi:hypothetical protein
VNNAELAKLVPTGMILVVRHHHSEAELAAFQTDDRDTPRYVTEASLYLREHVVYAKGKAPVFIEPPSYYAVAYCSPRDPPSRRLGYRIAVQRVLKEYREDTTRDGIEGGCATGQCGCGGESL